MAGGRYAHYEELTSLEHISEGTGHNGGTQIFFFSPKLEC